MRFTFRALALFPLCAAWAWWYRRRPAGRIARAAVAVGGLLWLAVAFDAALAAAMDAYDFRMGMVLLNLLVLATGWLGAIVVMRPAVPPRR